MPTKSSSFAITTAAQKYKNAPNLKSFVEAFGDILISFGSDFSEPGSHYSRGIFRNPHWIFEEKYTGLAILLHGFTGVVASKYFPKKSR